MKTALLLIAACVSAHCFTPSVNAADAAKKKAKASLFQRIGGQAAIDAAVDRFYVKVLADARVNHFFEDVNMKRQIRRQKAFLGAALGGPVPYEGKDLRRAHRHLDITEKDFNVIAEHLTATLTDLKVDPKLIGEIMAVVATTKDAVLNRPKGAK